VESGPVLAGRNLVRCRSRAGTGIATGGKVAGRTIRTAGSVGKGSKADVNAEVVECKQTLGYTSSDTSFASGKAV